MRPSPTALRRLVVILLAAASAFTAPTPSTANLASTRTWYVRADARAGGAGTVRRPFRSIQRAIGAARPGDTVRVAAGVYREDLESVRSGTRARPITLAGHGARIVGDGDGRLIEIGNDWIVLRGFEISSADVLLRIQHASHVRIVDNRFHDAGSECLRITYLSTSVRIVDNRIRGCGRSDF